MRLELLEAYPSLLNAHSKYGGSCSIYIMKPDVLLYEILLVDTYIYEYVEYWLAIQSCSVNALLFVSDSWKVWYD